MSPKDWQRKVMDCGTTKREFETLALVARGMGNGEIAQLTHCSIDAVKSRLRQSIMKLREPAAQIGVESMTRTGLAVVYLHATVYKRPPIPLEWQQEVRWSLTNAERRVLERIPQGLSNQQVAEYVGLNALTVKSYLLRAAPKLARFASAVEVVHANRTGLAVICLSAGITKTAWPT